LNHLRATLLSTALACFLTLPHIAQAIVNIDQSVIASNKEGIDHTVHIAADGAEGNSTKNSIRGDLLSKWKHHQHTEFLLLQYSYGKSNGRLDTNRSFAHIRHRTQLHKQWGIELFGQVEKNTFARLSSRSLIGAGIRFTALEIPKKTAIYFGLGSFYERELLSNIAGATDAHSQLWRANSYLVLRHQINEQLRLNSTTYYQPALQSSSDYRLLEEASANIRIIDSVSLKVGIDFTYDSRPPQTVKANDLRYSTGLEILF